MQFADPRIKNRSMDELRAARQHVAQQIAAAAATTRRATRRFVFATMRGD